MSITVTINADTQDSQTIAALVRLAEALEALTAEPCCMKRPFTEEEVTEISDIIIHAHQKPR